MRDGSRARGAPVPIAVVLAVVLALGVGACSDGDDELGEPPTAPTASAPTTTTTDAPATTTTTTGPRLDDVRIGVTLVASGLESPVAFAVRSGDPRLFVAEQAGRVRAIRNGVVDAAPVLDLTGDVTDERNEQGLLGLAFSPDGRRLYVDFTDRAGDTRIHELAVGADGAVDLASRRELLAIDQPYSNHNGGHLAFGPDGMLYVAMGDGGGGGDPDRNAQDLRSLLGKILRIDPNPAGDAPYSVPADNPFVSTRGARAEVWMYGLRNPWRFSFDRENGDMWIGDVGQSAFEEIDFAPADDQAGANWGWPVREGAHDFSPGSAPGARDPIFEYGRDEGVAVTGGYVYRGAAIPALRGAYVFADYAAGELRALVQRDGVAVAERRLGVQVPEITSFGEDADGELYVLSRSGEVYRIVPE